jgi:hypothetical protein
MGQNDWEKLLDDLINFENLNLKYISRKLELENRTPLEINKNIIYYFYKELKTIPSPFWVGRDAIVYEDVRKQLYSDFKEKIILKSPKNIYSPVDFNDKNKNNIEKELTDLRGRSNQ